MESCRSVFQNFPFSLYILIIVGGAIAGGITGEMFGDGFKKGAVFGAVAGVISYGVDARFGKHAGESIHNKVVIAGLKGGLNGLARGGDFIEGFGYAAVYSFNTKQDKKSKKTEIVKELKDLGIEINGELVNVEKTQTIEDGVVTTKFEIYVKKDLGSLSVEPDAKSLFETSTSFETNSSIIMMSVSVKSTGALTIDARLGFENKYLTTPYAKLNEEFSGSYSRDTTPGIELIPHMWRRYQWDTTVTKGHANLAVGIIYHPISEPLVPCQLLIYKKFCHEINPGEDPYPASRPPFPVAEKGSRTAQPPLPFPAKPGGSLLSGRGGDTSGGVFP